MIIRILGEGQYDVEDSRVEELNTLDGQLQDAVDAGDTAAFGPVLAALHAAVRDRGTAVPADMIVPSDLVLPAADAELAELTALLTDDGLIPG
ncbi:hypothetical protein ABZ863_12985 [Saccharomonospora sp. NPDC046836]|uniref:PspA-associated protein PspAA n=1 Tax=Saccharomonospora sp. NPDC046836 TaxID=3156921 RepID=UPI0033C53816